MSVRTNGYICYAFACDHDGCGSESLMSDADELSAAIRLQEKGWTFQLNPHNGPALALCPVHAQTSATIMHIRENQ